MTLFWFELNLDAGYLATGQLLAKCKYGAVQILQRAQWMPELPQQFLTKFISVTDTIDQISYWCHQSRDCYTFIHLIWEHKNV